MLNWIKRLWCRHEWELVGVIRNPFPPDYLDYHCFKCNSQKVQIGRVIKDHEIIECPSCGAKHFWSATRCPACGIEFGREVQGGKS